MDKTITIQLDTAHLSREIDRLTAEAEKRIAEAKANSDSQVILDGVAKMAELTAEGFRFSIRDFPGIGVEFAVGHDTISFKKKRQFFHAETLPACLALFLKDFDVEYFK